jgi:hypothetical protein
MAEHLSLMSIAQVVCVQLSVMPTLLTWTHLLVRTGGFMWTLLYSTLALDLHMVSSMRLSNIAVFQVGAEIVDRQTQVKGCAELHSFLDMLPC